MRCLLVADTELNGCCLSPQSPVSAEAFRRFNEPPTDDLPSVHSAFFLLVASRHSRSEALSTVAKTLSSNTSAIVSKESHGGARAGAGSAAEEFRSDRPAVISWRKNRREEGKEREEQRTVEEEKTKNGAPRGPAAVPCELEKGRRTVCHESQGRRGGGRPRLGGARPAREDGRKGCPRVAEERHVGVGSLGRRREDRERGRQRPGAAYGFPRETDRALGRAPP